MSPYTSLVSLLLTCLSISLISSHILIFNLNCSEHYFPAQPQREKKPSQRQQYRHQEKVYRPHYSVIIVDFEQAFAHWIDIQKQSLRWIRKKGVFKNFTKFTGKHLCKSLFFKVTDFNFIKKEILAQLLSCEFCEIFLKNFFYRTPPVPASE